MFNKRVGAHNVNKLMTVESQEATRQWNLQGISKTVQCFSCEAAAEAEAEAIVHCLSRCIDDAFFI